MAVIETEESFKLLHHIAEGTRIVELKRRV